MARYALLLLALGTLCFFGAAGESCEDCSDDTAMLQKRGPKSGKAPKVFVGIASGAGYAARRNRWRRQWKCGRQLRAAGIQYKFIVGWPVDESRNLTVHRQGDQASRSEVSKASALRLEGKKYGDVHFVQLPDTYLDLQAKTFALLEYGQKLGASYVMKMDDDTCINGSLLLKAIGRHEANVKRGGPKALYFGSHRHNGTEYKSMLGRDRKIHPYFSGPCYMLSKDLIQDIVQDDEMNSVLWASYGSFDEDAQTGRWVAFAEKEHRVKVDWMLMKNVIIYKQGRLYKDGVPVEDVTKQKTKDGVLKAASPAIAARSKPRGRR